VGQPVTFTATVTSRYGTIPNGELVTFYDNGAAIGTGATASGIAGFTISSLTTRTHIIRTIYAGDATFKTRSNPVTQVVNGYTTSTTLVSTLNPSIYGQKVNWTATVTSSGSSIPTGNVSFLWSGNSIGSATLSSSGEATLTRTNLNTDSYPLTAVYLGNATNTGSTSAILNQAVKQTMSSAAISSSPNPSTQGQPVTFTATVTSPTVTPTGPVTFTAGKTVLGTGQLKGGKAMFTTSSVPIGSTKIKATYAGDSNIAKSSASLTQTVQ
jgi:Big-like domain-containing protein